MARVTAVFANHAQADAAIAELSGEVQTAANELKQDYLGRKDEIGNMAAAMQVFKDNAIRAERLAAEQRKEQGIRNTKCRPFNAPRRVVGAQSVRFLSNLSPSVELYMNS